MGRHATIGNSNVGHKNTTLKTASKRMTSHPLTLGRDVSLPGDKRGYMAAPIPMASVQYETDDAFGAKFTSRYAKSLGTIRGDWRKPSRGLWTIGTSAGTLKVTKGNVFLGSEYLGKVNMKDMGKISGRDLLITQVIAGTLTR